MFEVSTNHPPGTVVVVTGELTRYAKFGQDLSLLRVPRGTGIAWHCGPSVKRNIDYGLQMVMADSTSQWAWIIGDDHSFSERTLLTLLDANVDCIAPLCTMRTPPFATCLGRNRENVPLADLPDVKCYLLKDDETYGDAGLLMRKTVIAATGPPWQDHPRTGVWDVEDRVFIARIRAAGFPVYVDLTTAIGHVTPCEILPEKKNGSWQASLKFGGRPL